MPKFGKRSKKRLKGVDSRLVNVMNEVIKMMDITIIEGVRSQERQLELLESGATKVKHSKHMDGKAVDVAPYPIDWGDRDRFHYMGGMIMGVSQQMGIKIRFGGDWNMNGIISDNYFDDLVHFELV